MTVGGHSDRIMRMGELTDDELATLSITLDDFRQAVKQVP